MMNKIKSCLEGKKLVLIIAIFTIITSVNAQTKFQKNPVKKTTTKTVTQSKTETKVKEKVYLSEEDFQLMLPIMQEGAKEVAGEITWAPEEAAFAKNAEDKICTCLQNNIEDVKKITSDADFESVISVCFINAFDEKELEKLAITMKREKDAEKYGTELGEKITLSLMKNGCLPMMRIMAQLAANE